MNTRTLIVAVMAVMLATGSALAQMRGGGHMGMGGGSGSGSGHMGMGYGVGSGPGYMGAGYGYGMDGAGDMMSGMMGNTVAHGYLDTLNPIDTPQEAQAVIQGFIDVASSDLSISELWEYETVYKAELSDTNGAKAFDLIVDKFTGAVSPEMGMSMMLNASYGMSLYKAASFGINLTLTPQQARDAAQEFVNKNALGYALDVHETYPGYYKFHTKVGAEFGMDIMVNGYSGGIWMNTILGLPLNRF